MKNHKIISLKGTKNHEEKPFLKEKFFVNIAGTLIKSHSVILQCGSGILSRHCFL